MMMMTPTRSAPVIRATSTTALLALLAVGLAACTGDSGAATVNNSNSGDFGGTGTVTIDGEPFEVTNVRCREMGGSNIHSISANGPDNTFVQVRFDRVDPFSEYDFDKGSIRYSPDSGLMSSQVTEALSGSEKHATGWAEIYVNPHAPAERRGEPQRVEVDIRCD